MNPYSLRVLVWVMWVTYSIFNNKGASKITVSYLLVTNQKGAIFQPEEVEICFLYCTSQMAGKLYKTGESFSLDSDSSKQSLSALTWENWWVHEHPCQFTDGELGPPAFSMEVFGHATEFSSEREASCLCSWTGSCVTRDKESQQPTVRQGRQYLTFCWATNPWQGKAWRPEPD